MIDKFCHSNKSGSLAPASVGASGGSAGCLHDAGSLVRYTKSNSADINETIKSRQSRARRFALKSVVNDIFPNSRTSKCHRIRAPQREVEVWRGMSAGIAGKAFYKGLYTCGRVWTCPICAAKIAQGRRTEVKQAMEKAKSLGLKVLFMTMTLPHGCNTTLKYTLDAFSVAEKLLWSSRSGIAIREKYGIVGSIKTTEVTWGEDNGWHPHKHALLFVSKDVEVSEINAWMSYQWVLTCQKKGLPIPGLGRGLVIEDGSKASDYISKWGLEDEMTKSHVKVAKKEGRLTPFGFLQDILDTGDARSWALFQEYSDTFKGKRQMFWSRGLRALLLPDLEEVSDEYLASESADESNDAILFATLSVMEWRAIKFFKYESTLLDFSEGVDSSGQLQIWLNSVTDAYSFATENFSLSKLNSMD